MGSVTRGECGNHILRILLADHLIAVDTEVNARAYPQEQAEGFNRSTSGCRRRGICRAKY